MVSWLVIGIGDITRRRVIPAILAEPRSKLAGIVTRDPAKAEPYNVPSWTTLDAALPECQATIVYVATPVALHAPQTILALRDGRHVLCEKPMAMNYAEAASMVRTAAECSRTLGVAYYRRLYDKVKRARQLIETGAIGRPVFAEATAHSWFHPVDGFRGWLIDPALAAGGPLRDVGSHRIDLLNYFFGAPERVSGHLSTLVHPTQVEDNATVMIEYQGGVRATVDVRWHSRVERDEFRIRGTEGELDLSPLTGPHLSYPAGVEQAPPHANIHYPLIEDFAGAILSGTQPLSTGATALPTEWIMDAASTRSPLTATR